MRNTPRRSPLGPVAALEDRVVPATAFALQPGNALVSFSTENPAAANPPVAVTGLAAGEALVGIDFRPQNGYLYGLATAAGGSVRLYAISVQTGFATPLAAAQTFTDAAGAAVPIAGANFGFDFNPAVDRLRVTTDAGVNFRINPNTGLIVDGDPVAVGVNPDGAIDPAVAVVSGSAYTNNAPNTTDPTSAPVTTLYVLDASTNRLLIQSDPNGGTVTGGLPVTLGGAPLDFTAANGFDISDGVTAPANNAPATGPGYAVLTTSAGTRLYGIELSTGVATDYGPIAAGTAPASGLAVQSATEQPGLGDLGTPLLALSSVAGSGNSLSRFTNAKTESGQFSQPITGVALGETLVGFDFRPATGQLVGLGVNAAADTGTLYLIDPQTRAATPIGTPGSVAFTTDGTAAVDLPDPATAGYGFDFNPTVDRVRVTTSTGLNFRLNPANPAQVAVDGNPSVAGTNPDAALNGATTKLDAVAYTNSYGQPLGVGGATTLYGLDSATNSLYLQSNPNGGVTALVGAVTLDGAPLDFTAAGGFDILPNVRALSANAAVTSGFGYALLTVAGTTKLYRIDLTTGAASNPRFTLSPAPFSGLAAAQAPVGTVAFTVFAHTSSTPTSANEGDGTVTVSLSRTGGTSGAFSVTVTPIAGGTAPGVGFGPIPTTVTFADGQRTATLVIPIIDDAVRTADGVTVLQLSAPTNGAVLGAPTVAVVTVTDNDGPPAGGAVQFALAAATVSEGAGLINVTLTRTGATTAAATVTVTATGGTATNGGDYTGVPATVTFAAGQTTATLVIPILDDATAESDETVTLTLSAPTGGAALGAQATTTVTILDNDAVTLPSVGTIEFASAAVTVAEGAGSLTVSLVRRGGAAGSVTINVVATGGTATLGADYTGVPATVTFADGQTTATLVIPILEDTLVEGPETALLSLTAPTGGVNAGPQATNTVTIADNDAATPPVVRPSVALVGGRADGTARLLSGTGGSFAAGATVTFPGLSGVARVAVGDLNGDGTPDYVGGAGPGGASRVVALDGKTNAVLFSLDAFEAGFTGGVFVAVGDFTGDGRAEVVVTPDQGGGPVVAVYGGTGAQVARFFGIEDPAFRGGARSAVGDVNGDGRPDLVVAAGFGGGPRVALFDGTRLLTPVPAGVLPPKLRPDFFVFESTLRNGVFVASADLSGDAAAELIVGGGPGGGPRVLALNGADLVRDGAQNPVANFFAGDVATRGGVRVATRDLDGDGRAELLAGSGDGLPGRVRLYRGTSFPAANGAEPAGATEFTPFDDAALANGVFVG